MLPLHYFFLVQLLIYQQVLKLADFGSCRGIYSKQVEEEVISVTC